MKGVDGQKGRNCMKRRIASTSEGRPQRIARTTFIYITDGRIRHYTVRNSKRTRLPVRQKT